MRYTSVDLKVSFKDILAMLFRRQKKCLFCEAPVKRKTNKKYLGERWSDVGGRNEIHFAKAKKYEWSIVYICTSCGDQYEPNEFW